MTKTMLADKPLTPGTCEWCGAACDAADTSCSTRCEALLVRHEGKAGRAVLRELKRWRLHRGRKGTPGEGAMGRLAAITDQLLKEDRARRKLALAESQGSKE